MHVEPFAKFGLSMTRADAVEPGSTIYYYVTGEDAVLPYITASGPAPVPFRSGAHVRRPSVRRPRVISSRGLSVCGAGCRSR
jgi:hypothetical protein